MVINIAQDDYFYAAQTFDAPEGIAFSLQTGVGTSDLEYIEKITGQLSLQEVIAAANRGSKIKMGRKLNSSEIKSLQDQAFKGSREI